MRTERLRELRQNQSVTQVQISVSIGITTRQYQRLEAGSAKPSLDTLIALADYFNISIDYLVGRTDKSNITKLKIGETHEKTNQHNPRTDSANHSNRHNTDNPRNRKRRHHC